MVRPSIELLCIGQDGQERGFWAVVEPDQIHTDKVTLVRVFQDRQLASSRWVDFTFVRFDANTFRCHIMDNHGYAEYSAQGIPDALLVAAPKMLGCRRVCSSIESPNLVESHNQDAREVWDRLEAAGRATYDRQLGRFFIQEAV